MLQQMLQSSGGGGGRKDGEPDLEQLLRMAKLAQGMGGGAKGGEGDDSMAGFESLLRDVQRGNTRGAAARAARERDAERERQQPGFNWQVALVVFILLLIGPFRLALCMCSLCLCTRATLVGAGACTTRHRQCASCQRRRLAEDQRCCRRPRRGLRWGRRHVTQGRA